MSIMTSSAPKFPGTRPCTHYKGHTNRMHTQIYIKESVNRAMSDSSTSSEEDTLGNGGRIDYKVAVFSAQHYVKEFLSKPLRSSFSHVHMIEPRLDSDTAKLAAGYDAAVLFVNDMANEKILNILAQGGIKTIAMRCAGYDRVDLHAAESLGLKVVRVPAYSPRSVAEHALCLAMAVARNLHLAHTKVVAGNYTLSGLVGLELSGKTFGVVGTGNIGIELIKLLRGFDSRVLAFDINPSDLAVEAGAEYVSLESLLSESDVVSLHVPLLPSTKHLINAERLEMMKPNGILVNASRGGLIDTVALVEALERGHLRGVGLDVYEGEESLFFVDFTEMNKTDRMKAWDRGFQTLKSFPQVIITPHVAFLTEEALKSIAEVTVANLKAAALGEDLVNQVKPRQPSEAKR